ncbi:hypothetical protein V7122_02380 [Bacillus sp. JJ1532]|uniref:hypothetical protein n=1 Tax=Bacillus sp. JJ1532 TaxID=3122958 RepID=UPI002FFF0FC0
MGILYDSVKNQKLIKEMMKNSFLEKLLENGITESQQGKSVYLMDYHELKREVALATFREIKTESAENAWF